MGNIRSFCLLLCFAGTTVLAGIQNAKAQELEAQTIRTPKSLNQETSKRALSQPKKFCFDLVHSELAEEKKANDEQSDDADEGEFFEISANANLLTAPSNSFIVHDGTNDDQVFPSQNWLAVSTSLSGATVSIEAQGPFKHWLKPASQRDAKLDLVVVSADPLSGWAVSIASDQTDYSSGANSAVVTASSTALGAATLGLTVTFIEETATTLNSGSYRMQVIGTIAGN